jgi:hypothetical protein
MRLFDDDRQIAFIDGGFGLAANGSFRVTDEYGREQPPGAFTVSPSGSYTFVVLLEARRLGTDEGGRTCIVAVTVPDSSGNPATKTVQIAVEHDQRR